MVIALLGYLPHDIGAWIKARYRAVLRYVLEGIHTRFSERVDVAVHIQVHLTSYGGLHELALVIVELDGPPVDAGLVPVLYTVGICIIELLANDCNGEDRKYHRLLIHDTGGNVVSSRKRTLCRRAWVVESVVEVYFGGATYHQVITVCSAHEAL